MTCIEYVHVNGKTFDVCMQTNLLICLECVPCIV